LSPRDTHLLTKMGKVERGSDMLLLARVQWLALWVFGIPLNSMEQPNVPFNDLASTFCFVAQVSSLVCIRSHVPISYEYIIAEPIELLTVTRHLPACTFASRFTGNQVDHIRMPSSPPVAGLLPRRNPKAIADDQPLETQILGGSVLPLDEMKRLTFLPLKSGPHTFAAATGKDSSKEVDLIQAFRVRNLPRIRAIH
jgi:hypothetical protein